jgi:carbonic anhydrase
MGRDMKLPGRLVEGYHSFVDTRLPLERSRFEKMAASGQHPEVMVICCCDSRVSPEVIFDAHPGELFVVRNVANLVPPYSPSGFTHGVSAALEFAVQGLNVKYIVVMGHTHCGGIRAYSDHKDRLNPGDFIDSWMSLIAPAAQAVNDADHAPDYLDRLGQASVLTTLNNLMTFPWIKSRVEQAQLELLGAYFDVADGSLAIHDRTTQSFVPIEGDIVPRVAAPAK